MLIAQYPTAEQIQELLAGTADTPFDAHRAAGLEGQWLIAI